MKLADLPEARRLAHDLVSIKAALGNLGLFKTMHALDAATVSIGFEIEEHLMHHAKIEAQK